MLPRRVEAEDLDGLAPEDPRAQRSRRDLRRIHGLMGTRRIARRELADLVRVPRERRLRVLDLGCGDATILLQIAQTMAPAWKDVDVVLLDRQEAVPVIVLNCLERLGWRASTRRADAREWAAARVESVDDRWDLILANLFLHHFEGEDLAAILHAVAARCDAFFACEPRRSQVALFASHLVGAIGAGPVTRKDAVLSVRAGFRDFEIGALWREREQEWALREFSAGIFSHCFCARRIIAGATLA